MRIGTLVVVLWLLIGVFAANQRGYFGDGDKGCAELSTIALTMVAGPLNYWFVDPEVTCDAPQPVQN